MSIRGTSSFRGENACSFIGGFSIVTLQGVQITENRYMTIMVTHQINGKTTYRFRGVLLGWFRQHDANGIPVPVISNLACRPFWNQVPRDTSPLNDQRCKIWMNATCSVFTANYEDPLKSVGFLNDRFEIHSINSAFNFPDIFQLSLRLYDYNFARWFCHTWIGSGQPILPCSSIFHQLKNSANIQLKCPQWYLPSPRRWSPKRFFQRHKKVSKEHKEIRAETRRNC